MRHPDCDTLEALLGPDWACAGDWRETDGLGAAWREADRLFTIDREDGLYIVADEEAAIPTLGPLTTLGDVASALASYIAAYCNGD